MGFHEEYIANLDQFVEPVVTTDATRTTYLEQAHSVFPAYMKDAADATANANTAAIYFWRAPYKCEIKSAYLTPSGSLTAHDTNYATVYLLKNAVTAASQTTKITGGSGNWAAATAEALTNSATVANLQMAAGDQLAFKIQKSGTGVAVPAGTGLTVHITQR